MSLFDALWLSGALPLAIGHAVLWAARVDERKQRDRP